MAGIVAMLLSGREYLNITIIGGEPDNGFISSHSFPTSAQITSVTGGSGSYSYQWMETDDGLGGWSFNLPTNAATTVSVVGVETGLSSVATVWCRITDTATGYVQDSATIEYSWGHL